MVDWFFKPFVLFYALVPKWWWCLVAKLYQTLLQSHGLQPARFLRLWNSPGKNTGVGCHFLLQRIFLTQGSYSCLLHWQEDSLPLSHKQSHIMPSVLSVVWLKLCVGTVVAKSTACPDLSQCLICSVLVKNFSLVAPQLDSQHHPFCFRTTQQV